MIKSHFPIKILDILPCFSPKNMSPSWGHVSDFDYHVILFHISLYLIQTQSTPLKRVATIVLRTFSKYSPIVIICKISLKKIVCKKPTTC